MHGPDGDHEGASAAEPPPVPTGRLAVRRPPELPTTEAAGVLATALPMLGSLGSILLLATTGGAARSRSLLAAGLFLFATVGFLLLQVDQRRRTRAVQVDGSRLDYLDHLAALRRRARAAAGLQRRAMLWRYPPPTALPMLAEEGSRLWRADPEDEDFLTARFGVAEQPSALRLSAEEEWPADRLDPASVAAARRLLTSHQGQPDLPAAVDLRAVREVAVLGPPEQARAVARALLCSAVAAHSASQLRVAVLATADARPSWEWVKWLPHSEAGGRRDAVGPRRLVCGSVADLELLLGSPGADPGSRPHLLVTADGCPATDLERLAGGAGGRRVSGVTLVRLGPRLSEQVASPGVCVLEPGPQQTMRVRPPPPRPAFSARPDQCGPATAEAFARRLSRLRHSADAAPSGAATKGGRPNELLPLLGLGSIEAFDPRSCWSDRPARARLRVPVGVDENGHVVELDLKEPAHQGVGPHGLVVGATGSGKSEFLRTLVLALTMTHSPAELNLVLADFKGGATFDGLAGLPHVSATITNLAAEHALVERMQDALSGELVRRQEILRAAGGLSSAHDYEQARASGSALTPLPSLLVIVDEFSEMLDARPELLETFVAIGRLGRSLGLHLLLATQRLEEGRLRGLDSHLSYRVGLRTFSAAESRAVLGVPDAASLPAVPGMGLLRTGPDSLHRFTAAYVSGPESPPAAGGSRPVVLPYTTQEVRGTASPAPPLPAAARLRPSLLEAAVHRMAGAGQPAHRVWLPPLDLPETLDGLMPALAVDAALGLVDAGWRARGPLVLPVGSVDRPRQHRREPLVVDLGGAGGHAAVVGGPRSGKSTMLRTLAAATALTSTPAEVQVYVVDLGGGAFTSLASLPQVAGVATGSEPDLVRRTVAEVAGLLSRREELFAARGIDSIESYRALRATGAVDDGYGEIVLVVDGWGTLRVEYGELETELTGIAERGLAFGVHLVASATRWADFRTAVRDCFGTRLELRLGDPADSAVARSAAGAVPRDRPGRGILPTGLHFLAALPRIDSRPDAGSLTAGVEDLVHRCRAAWGGPPGPRLRVLPQRVPLETLRAGSGPGGDPRGLLLGVDQADLAPVWVLPDTEPHLLVYGDPGSGRTALGRAYLHEVMLTRSSSQAQIVLVDYRRSLLGEVAEPYLLHYLTAPEPARRALAELGEHLAARLPGPEVTARQLRDRSWWAGAEVFCVVDDYELVSTAQAAPLHPLLSLLPQARDVGLHLVVMRRAGGAARAAYEPVLQCLRELGCPALLLSGSSEEGPLVGGVRARPAPPGRALLVSRDRPPRVVQTAWAEPAA